MGSKRGYLFLTMACIIASVGTGFVMKEEKEANIKAALQSLETARLQLSRQADGQSGSALSLIDQAIREIKVTKPSRS